MHYSLVAASLFAAVVVANPGLVVEIPDGQLQEYGSPVVSESTVYTTAEVTITSCDSTVKNCPAHSKTSLPVVVTPSVSVPVSVSVSVPVYISTPTPSTEVATSIPSVPVSSVITSSAPIIPSVSVIVPSTPSPSGSVVTPGISVSVPIYASIPTSSSEVASTIPSVPSVPTPPFPIGTAPVPSRCPVCPSAATIYSTVTVSPSGIPTPAVSIPTSEPIKGSTIPVVPIPSPSVSVPIIPAPIPIPSRTAPGIPAPSGTAPVGTGASSGYITGPKPTGSLTPFTGAANAISSSLMGASLAALAALLLV